MTLLRAKPLGAAEARVDARTWRGCAPWIEPTAFRFGREAAAPCPGSGAAVEGDPRSAIAPAAPRCAPRVWRAGGRRVARPPYSSPPYGGGRRDRQSVEAV